VLHLADFSRGAVGAVSAEAVPALAVVGGCSAFGARVLVFFEIVGLGQIGLIIHMCVSMLGLGIVVKETRFPRSAEG
jgi:hypothetical protein